MKTSDRVTTCYRLTIGLFVVAALTVPAATATGWSPVEPGRSWSFPRDHGAHPDHY